MFCHKCGNRLVDGSVYCSTCGTKVIQPTNTISDDRKNEQLNQTTPHLQESGYGLPKANSPAHILETQNSIDNSEKKQELTEKTTEKSSTVLKFAVCFILFAVSKFCGKAMAHDPTIAYLLPSFTVGTIVAVILYFILGRFDFFKPKKGLRILLSIVALAGGIIAGGVAAAVTAVIIIMISSIVNNSSK